MLSRSASPLFRAGVGFPEEEEEEKGKYRVSLVRRTQFKANTVEGDRFKANRHLLYLYPNWVSICTALGW